MFKIKGVYTRKDSSRLFEWKQDRTSTIFGHTIHKGQCPIFVTYKKQDVESSDDHKDAWINTNTLRWHTWSNQTLKSKNVIRIINPEENSLTLHLFVKKDDATYESNFYYLG